MFEDIVIDIKNSYNALWSVKQFGGSVEIVTPVSTTNNLFVSVFLTQRRGEYVVTDGGWLFNEFYNTPIDVDGNEYRRLFSYYMEHYNIKMAKGNGSEFYYKKTGKASLVPNIVYDLSSFISAVVSATFIEFKDVKEVQEIKKFTQEAKAYLKAIVNKSNIAFNDSIHESIKNVKFGAVLTQNGNSFILINFITGSNVSNFINSACKSNANFELADNSSIKEFINHKISIVNNTSDGYQQEKVAKYISLLEMKHKIPPIMWSEKEKIKEFL